MLSNITLHCIENLLTNIQPNDLNASFFLSCVFFLLNNVIWYDSFFLSFILFALLEILYFRCIECVTKKKRRIWSENTITMACYSLDAFFLYELLLSWFKIIDSWPKNSNPIHHIHLLGNRCTLSVRTTPIYHGRHTDESSISIFGDIGGVLTRVDDSMWWWDSGVEAGDRLG